MNRLSRFVVQDPGLPGSGVEEKGLGESLRLGRGNRNHLIAPDLRLLAVRASRHSKDRVTSAKTGFSIRLLLHELDRLSG